MRNAISSVILYDLRMSTFCVVKWKPVEMADLIRVMKPVRAAWEELAYNLIKKDETSLKGYTL